MKNALYWILLSLLFLGIQDARRAYASPYATEVLSDNPVAYWRFEDTSGSTATDSAGSNHGTYNNVALGQASAAPALGTAAGFNGTSADVSVPALGVFADLSIEAWAYIDNFPGGWSSLYNTDGCAFPCAHWQFVNLDVPRFEWALAGSDWSNGFVFGGGSWYHIVTTYEQGTGVASLYVNGQFQEHLFVLSGLVTTQSLGRIGSWGGGGRFVDGLIDEVAVSGSALTASRVLAHYNAATVPEPVSLVFLGVGVIALGVLGRRRATPPSSSTASRLSS